jgi:hypothetical protein
MTNTSRRQRDLFDPPVAPNSIPITVQGLMLELLKALLTEALTGGPAEAGVVSEEVGDDEDHA